MLGSSYTAGDLIVVWTYWNTGSSSNNLTAVVTDQNNPNSSWVSAVGPTLQSASNSAAQIFYAKYIQGSGTDTVTVKYYLNGVQTSANASGCVFVEYQGADTLYPLDSGSEAISNGQGTNMDSGTVAPANANILLFGGGTNDTGTASAGTGFMSITGISNQSIVEQNTTPITTNNTLQRATAGLSANGNWIMQMAVFRAASWGLNGAGSPLFTGPSFFGGGNRTFANPAFGAIA